MLFIGTDKITLSNIGLPLIITLVISGGIPLVFSIFSEKDEMKLKTTETLFLESQITFLKKNLEAESKEKNNYKEKIDRLENNNTIAYIEIFSLENNLREFVEKSLISKWGKDKWRDKIPPDVKKDCTRYKDEAAKNRKLHNYDEKLSILAYSSLHELSLVIQDDNNWHEVFKDIMVGKDSTIIAGNIATLVPFRDKIAHNRQISKDDLDTIKSTCKLLKGLISD
jgi:hypothetical protein